MSRAGQRTIWLGIGLGSLLGVVGVVAYIVTDFASITALLPTVFGIIVGAIGLLGRTNIDESHAVYGIGLLAVLGIVGSLRAVPDKIALLSGEAVDSVVATLSQAILILVSIILLLSVLWYIVESR